MDIRFVTQQMLFVFTLNGQYYRVSFERTQKEGHWLVHLIDVSRNETVYSKTLDAVVSPDIQLAEDIITTYMLRGQRLQ